MESSETQPSSLEVEEFDSIGPNPMAHRYCASLFALSLQASSRALRAATSHSWATLLRLGDLAPGVLHQSTQILQMDCLPVDRVVVGQPVDWVPVHFPE